MNGVPKSSSFRRSAKEKRAALKGNHEQLDGKLQQLKNNEPFQLQDMNINSTTKSHNGSCYYLSAMDFLCYCWEFSVQSKLSWSVCLAMFWNSMNYLSLLRVKGLMWIWESWKNQSEALKSPGKVLENCLFNFNFNFKRYIGTGLQLARLFEAGQAT